jgi:hypothetical protein
MKRTIFLVSMLGSVYFSLLTLASLASAQTWVQQFPSGTPPAARDSAGNAYDQVNDRLILFSGAQAAGIPPPNDVWVLTNATGSGGTPSWLQLTPTGGPPQGRNQQTVIYDPTSNRIIVHGGCGGNCSPAASDTWVLTNANGLGGTPNWLSLPSSPIGRAGHVAAYDPGSNRMIVFGGHTAFPFTDRNDVWVLKDANGIGSPAWVQLIPAGSPPPARGEPASGIYDPASNRLILVGGRTTLGADFNDVWILSHANGLGGTPQWTQLFPTGTSPAPRGAHSMVYDPNTNRIILFGGYNDNSASFFNDVWILTNANGASGSSQWIQLTTIGGPPLRRFLHSVGYSTASNRMVIAMGGSDQVSGFYLNDVWALVFNQLPVAMCKNVTVPAGPSCTANASINDGSFDPDGDPITITQSPPGPYPPGDTLVTLTVTDSKGASSQCVATVTVVDNTPPTITGISANPSVLWPPNHEMVNVTVNYSVSDNCTPSAAITCALSVSSNEPVNGTGDGDTAPDWEIIDAHHVRLRAERAGNGNGRVYTITITCADGNGNSSVKTVTVSVPKNRS